MSSGGRIDIVVFPNGGREITGNIVSDPKIPMSILIQKVNSFVASLSGLTKPERYTAYYEPESVDSIEFTEYNKNNPIVHVDKADLGIPYDIPETENSILTPDSIAQQFQTVAVEFASLPTEIAEKYKEF